VTAQTGDGRPADADLYGTLGVTPSASGPEIRRAFRRLARQQHPDLNPSPDGPRRFAALASAYEILQDPARRARYDQTLRRSPAPTGRPQGAAGPPAWPVSADRPAARRGILELSPREAAHLARHPLTLRDARGRTIVLPAGTEDGDQIGMLQDGHAVVLTVSMRRAP
jgi:curved DNA-binding protein CbpA